MKKTQYAYSWTFTPDEIRALIWHGARYEFTDAILDYIDETVTVNLKEHEAWILKDAWEDDNYTLACGASELVNKIQNYMDEII